MTDPEERVQRLEDVEAIRALDAAGDTATARSTLWQPCVVDDVPHVAAGRYADRLLGTAAGWRCAREQVRFDHRGPLRDGWDDHRSGSAPAGHAATGALR